MSGFREFIHLPGQIIEYSSTLSHRLFVYRLRIRTQGEGDATHAWLEVFLPYIGWQGYDPTNYCIAEQNHIRVASGRRYSDTAPTSGTIYHGGGPVKLMTQLRVILLKADRNA